MRVKPVVKMRARKTVSMRSPVRAMARAAAQPALAARQAFVPSALHPALSVRRHSLPRLERWSRSRRRLLPPQPQRSALPPGEAMRIQMRMQAIEPLPSRPAFVRVRAAWTQHAGPMRVRQVMMIYYGPPAAEARRGCASSTSLRPWRESAPARSTAHVRRARQFPSPCRHVRHRTASSAPCPRTS